MEYSLSISVKLVKTCGFEMKIKVKVKIKAEIKAKIKAKVNT